MSPEMYEKTKRSIRDHGYVVPVIVRRMPAGMYEIVDGEHRYRAARELGMDQIRVVDLGAIPDHQARALTLKLNDIRGESDEEKRAEVIRDLFGAYSPTEMLEVLPYDVAYFSQFPEFSEWAAKTEEPEPPLVDESDTSISADVSKYDGMAVVHMLIPKSEVKGFKEMAKGAMSDHGLDASQFDLSLGQLVTTLLSGGE